MHEREDTDRISVVVDGVDHALTFHDEFTDVVRVSLRDFSANAGNVGELDDRFEDAVNVLLGVDGCVARDIVEQRVKVGLGRFGPDNLH